MGQSHSRRSRTRGDEDCIHEGWIQINLDRHHPQARRPGFDVAGSAMTEVARAPIMSSQVDQNTRILQHDELHHRRRYTAALGERRQPRLHTTAGDSAGPQKTTRISSRPGSHIDPPRPSFLLHHTHEAAAPREATEETSTFTKGHSQREQNDLRDRHLKPISPLSQPQHHDSLVANGGHIRIMHPDVGMEAKTAADGTGGGPIRSRHRRGSQEPLYLPFRSALGSSAERYSPNHNAQWRSEVTTPSTTVSSIKATGFVNEVIEEVLQESLDDGTSISSDRQIGSLIPEHNSAPEANRDNGSSDEVVFPWTPKESAAVASDNRQRFPSPRDDLIAVRRQDRSVSPSPHTDFTLTLSPFESFSDSCASTLNALALDSPARKVSQTTYDNDAGALDRPGNRGIEAHRRASDMPVPSRLTVVGTVVGSPLRRRHTFNDSGRPHTVNYHIHLYGQDTYPLDQVLREVRRSSSISSPNPGRTTPARQPLFRLDPFKPTACESDGSLQPTSTPTPLPHRAESTSGPLHVPLEHLLTSGRRRDGRVEEVLLPAVTSWDPSSSSVQPFRDDTAHPEPAPNATSRHSIVSAEQESAATRFGLERPEGMAAESAKSSLSDEIPEDTRCVSGLKRGISESAQLPGSSTARVSILLAHNPPADMSRFRQDDQLGQVISEAARRGRELMQKRDRS